MAAPTTLGGIGARSLALGQMLLSPAGPGRAGEVAPADANASASTRAELQCGDWTQTRVPGNS